MPIVVVGNEKNFNALRPRLFEGKVSGKAAAEVAEEVRRANPHVDLDKLTPGTVLTIPDSQNLKVRGDLSLDEATTKGAVEGVANFGKAALGDLVGTAERREAEAKADRRKVLKSLDAVRGDTTKARERGLAKELETARKALAEEDDRANERATTVRQAQEEWTAGLDALAQLVR